MRDLFELERERRDLTRYLHPVTNWIGDAEHGCFTIPSPIDRADLRIIASAGAGWDHVSVSRQNRCPNWPEMSFVAGLFFKPDEVAMQLHVPAEDHVNHHPFTLHWWRPQDQPIPRPHAAMVGPRPGQTIAEAEAEFEEVWNKHEREKAS